MKMKFCKAVWKFKGAPFVYKVASGLEPEYIAQYISSKEFYWSVNEKTIHEWKNGDPEFHPEDCGNCCILEVIDYFELDNNNSLSIHSSCKCDLRGALCWSGCRCEAINNERNKQ